MKLRLFKALLLSQLWVSTSVSSETTSQAILESDLKEKVLFIYQDADLSHHSESAKSIQKGIELAFSEVDNKIAGYHVKFKYLDHRGNVVRSKLNYKKFIDDPKGLVIYSGIHSPPLIKNRAFINENKALTLVPWAAGAPITRYRSAENWVFRLSIDDRQAGPIIVKHAMTEKNCHNPHLLLEDTPWGDSNLKSMSKALKGYMVNMPDVTRFGWNIKGRGAHEILTKMIQQKNDCLILVGNAIEGGIVAKAMLGLEPEQRLPIISHWGIIGGDFHNKINANDRQQLDLNFIQSCFAFTNTEQSHFAKKVFSRLKEFSQGRINQPSDLKAAVGFIHAYDLTKLLIQTINQTKLTGDMKQDRTAIRVGLENIQGPIQGLVKTYHQPFSVFSKNNTNAHEALNADDFCMGEYLPNDAVKVFKK